MVSCLKRQKLQLPSAGPFLHGTLHFGGELAHGKPMKTAGSFTRYVVGPNLVLTLALIHGHAQLPLESGKGTVQEGAQSPAKGGSITAGVFPPVYDANKLPITVGGTVKTGPIVFE